MRRLGWFLMAVLLLGALGVGVGVGLRGMRRDPEPDPAAMIERLREIARLETLEVHVSKTVSYVPDPPPPKSLAEDVLTWATWTISPREGRAIVSATGRIGLDVARLEVSSIGAGVVLVRLPRLVTTIELDPGATEIIRSNLDSMQTALLFEKGVRAVAFEIDRDARLHERARESAKTALERVLRAAGAREVRFVDAGAVSSSV